MRTCDFDYVLPPELIAQEPSARRDASRLLCLRREDGRLEHRQFGDLVGLLPPRALLVVNQSKVIPARIWAVNAQTGGRFEILLLESVATNNWWAMVRPGKRAPVGRVLAILHPGAGDTGIRATVMEVHPDGHRRLEFAGVADLMDVLHDLGQMPLPFYIHRKPFVASSADQERYQTVYAKDPGSVAAPTAGLHFTAGLLQALRESGREIASVTLHVGAGTFAPVKVDDVSQHVMHSETYEIGTEAADAVRRARQSDRPVIAVGTTSLRVLESAPRDGDGSPVATRGRTRLFVHPPWTFHVVNGLVTNFHLPRSTLLMLASAFASPGGLDGRGMILGAYAEAVRERYRFFSYGDAMFIH